MAAQRRRGTGSARTTPEARPAPEPPPPRPPPQPWMMARETERDGESSYTTARFIHLGAMHLPPMQRGLVWSREQQLAFVRSVWDGNPIPTVVTWSRYGFDSPVPWLIDGQQRLTALGVPIRSADGVLREPIPIRWDWQTGEWSFEVGEPITLYQLATFHHQEEWVARLDEMPRAQRSAMFAGMNIAQGVNIPRLSLRGQVGYCRRAMRALATPGVPWTDEALDGLEAACAAWEGV